jgi:hypothetical protein
MVEQRFPPGWDAQRVQRALDGVDNPTAVVSVAPDQASAAVEDEQAVITVPVALLPEIRRLLAAYKPKSS